MTIKEEKQGAGWVGIFLRVLNNLRLALFPIAYGLTGVLMGSTLNQIMIVDQGYAASLVGLFFAIPLLVSPIRVWIGYRSDGFPIFGRRREPYMILGAIITGIGAIIAVRLSINEQPDNILLILGMAVAFAVFGFGRLMGHNSFQALIPDRFADDQKQRAVTLYEVATMLGMVGGAGFIKKGMEVYDPAGLVQLTITVAGMFFVLALLGSIGNEPRTETAKAATEKAKEMPFREVLQKVVLADSQVRLFFVFVIFTFIGTLAQDVLLEPFGRLTLGMEVGEATRLTQFWGMGVLISMLLSGVILLKWLGMMKLMRIGIVASIFVFIGVIVSGATGNAAFFQPLVFVMGLGTGLAGAGMLSGVISFTTKIRAGLLMGVWGFANLLGRAIGGIMGGAVVDIVMKVIGGEALVAYSTVFVIEIIMLIIALYLTTKLDIESSAAKMEMDDSLEMAAK